ncbi:MAG: Rrf2 family transcriptional regulator [Actinomycetota bacterium]|nr:MAG: Rrf2 family transcriptional regulator [Actinomycetota bacterium]
MRLAARTDYALRAALELAAAGGSAVTTDELADKQKIPPRYLGNILGELRRAGVVRGHRGPEGGYTLARPADKISLADVIRALDGALAQVGGERPEHLEYAGAAASLSQVWIAVRASERAILDAVSLADVAAGRLPARVRKLLEDPAAWV